MKLSEALPRFKYVCMIISLTIVVPFSSYLLYAYDNTAAGISRTAYFAVSPGALPTTMRQVVDQENECQIGKADCSSDFCWAWKRPLDDPDPTYDDAFLEAYGAAFGPSGAGATGADDMYIAAAIEECMQQYCLDDVQNELENSPNTTTTAPGDGNCTWYDTGYAPPSPTPAPRTPIGEAIEACVATAATQMIGLPTKVPIEECVFMPVRLTKKDVRTNHIDICRAPTGVSAATEIKSVIAQMGNLPVVRAVSACKWHVHNQELPTCVQTILDDISHQKVTDCESVCSGETGTSKFGPCVNNCVVEAMTELEFNQFAQATFANWPAYACSGAPYGAFAKEDAFGVSESKYDRAIGSLSDKWSPVIHGESVNDIGDWLNDAGADTDVKDDKVRAGLIVAVVLSVILVFAVYADMVRASATLKIQETATFNVNAVSLYVVTLGMYWALAAVFWVMCVQTVYETTAETNSGIIHGHEWSSFSTISIFYLGIVNFVVAGMWTIRSIAAGYCFV